MRSVRSRLISLSMAALLVGAALTLALLGRYPLLEDEPPQSGAVLSDILAPPPSQQSAPHQLRPPLIPQAEPTTVAAVAPAIDPPSDPLADAPTITDPHWLRRPAHPERFYPRRAFMQAVEGRVELACFVEIDGRLACEVVEEAPPGYGFGEAALAMAAAHQMQPALVDGVAVRARYRMIVPFSAR